MRDATTELFVTKKRPQFGNFVTHDEVELEFVNQCL